ncbi:MAG: DUF4193 domain-containing protein [Actinomycetia bacterium]|nr:DUF4193 domain-containing protein [Actinomycetes bacterium]
MSTDEVSEEAPPEDSSELDEDLEEAPPVEDADDADGEESSDDTSGDDKDEALDELEAEELEMLTEDETSETLVVDEAAEMRAIRRAELALDQQGVAEAMEDEFVCSRCFLVLKASQLANPRKKICKDCAA